MYKIIIWGQDSHLHSQLHKRVYENWRPKEGKGRFFKQILLPYVPVYDKTKKEIISMSAEKSVDMTDKSWTQHRKLKTSPKP